MEIITYPHPTLRRVSRPVKRVDAELRSMAREMLELMYEARGVGLAANQVDLPVRMFVANLESDPEKGEEFVFINPVVSRPKGSEESEEGCLSLPELYGPVVRPKTIHLDAFSLSGQAISADLDGLAARVVQHEVDHLDGILFVDRMNEIAKRELGEHLVTFEAEFHRRQTAGDIAPDTELSERWTVWEEKYC